MSGHNQSEKVAVKGKEVFIGIDVHKESWQVTAQVGGEDVVPPDRVPLPVNSLLALLSSRNPQRWNFARTNHL